MKKIILPLTVLAMGMLPAQFKVSVEAPDTFAKKSIMIYTQNGSKDIYETQAQKKKGKWEVHIPKSYKGFLKAYFPENNRYVNFVSENKNIEMKLNTEADQILAVEYKDEANKTWEEYALSKDKREHILPVLSQIKNFYRDNSPFEQALKNEIEKLESAVGEPNTFLHFYAENSKYASENPAHQMPTQAYVAFLTREGDLLETSSLMRPVLVNYLKSLSRENLNQEVDTLLERLNLETSRGQTVLAELLNIFDVYGLKKEKEKYYQKATALSCAINQNLEKSIESIKNTEIGAVFRDYVFTENVKNTKAKKLSGVKAEKKVVLFWSSTCPHCLSELPVILENYKKIKAKGIEVIAISMDTDKSAYENAVKGLPWIHDSELRGWKGKSAETYHVHATPTYYVLNKHHTIIEKPANFSEFLSSNK